MRKRNKTSKFQENNSRYQFEMGSEGQITSKAQPKKSLRNDPEATGDKLMGAFTNPLPLNSDEEYGSDIKLDKEDNDSLATGEHLMGAFTNPLPQDADVEYGSELDPNAKSNLADDPSMDAYKKPHPRDTNEEYGSEIIPDYGADEPHNNSLKYDPRSMRVLEDEHGND